MRPGWIFLVGSVLIALAVGHLLRDSPGYVVRNPDGSYAGDITHYVYWTRLVTLGGVQSAYSGAWPETYAVYPPLTLYTYQAAGSVYRAVVDPTFDAEAAQRSLFLHEAIKFVALGWHVLAGIAIFGVLRRGVDLDRAGLAAGLYIANPAALYDVAHWAQPDGAHSLFSVLAIGALDAGALGLTGVAVALAVLAKPQAVSLVPLLGVATVVRTDGARRLGRLVLGGLGAALVCVSPFILSGTLAQLLSLPGTVASVMPVVSADAHNLWWLVAEQRGLDPLVTQDAARAAGPLTYRLVAGALVVAALSLGCWVYLTRRAALAEAAALSVLGWFVFTTQAHENHLFFALPLLSLAWPRRPALLVVFSVLSLTVLMNMLLHDQLVLEALGSGLDDPGAARLRLVNAGLNCVCWLGWSARVGLRRPRVTVPVQFERDAVRAPVPG